MHKPAHFQGKPPLEHIIEAHKKGQVAVEESHGIEIPGHLNAGADAAKETAVLFVLLWILLQGMQVNALLVPKIFFLFFSGWFIWKVGRSALLGWMRLERMHRLIEEERWEIEHHRPQEREELKELYRAKGFSGTLLDEVTDVLMADDNRLLQVMLQEELGLPLEAEEHPLKQAFGAGLGVVISFAISASVFFLLPPPLLLLSSALMVALSAAATAHWSRNHIASAVVWNLAVAALSVGVPYFVFQLFR